jgi:hypothetical protein
MVDDRGDSRTSATAERGESLVGEIDRARSIGKRETRMVSR